MQKTEIATETGWEDDRIDSVFNSSSTEENISLDVDSSTPQDIVRDTHVEPDALVAQKHGMDALLDPSDKVAPNTFRADKPMWRHPLPRTGLVIAGIGIIGVSVIQLTEGNSLVAPGSNLVATAPSATPTPKVPGTETGELQARLATVELRQKLQRVKEAKIADQKKSKQNQKPKTVAPTPSPQPTPVTSPSPQRVAYQTAPRYVSPAPVKVTTAQQKLAPQPQPQPSITPEKQWLIAANIGSYGQISSSNRTEAFARSSDVTAARDERDTNPQTSYSTFSRMNLPSGGVGVAPGQNETTRTNYPTAPVASTSDRASQSIAGSNTANNPPIPNVQNVRYSNSSLNLVIGTKAAGKLQTPIAWSGELQNPSQSFLVQLKEGLKASDGSVVIGKDSYLVARVTNASSGGILQMSAVSFLSNHNNRTVERPLPQGAILILGKGGKPLQAKTKRPNNPGTNIGMVLLSGASIAAGLVNQSTSQTFYGSGGSFSSSTTNPDPNYVAGFGQGIAQELVQQMRSRNQKMRQNIESQPDVFILNQGTSVQVFVNQSVSF